MKTYADYHIHSKYSKNKHGKGTLEEITQRAVELGLEEIAVTDHGLKHFMFGIKRKNVKKARYEINELNKKYPQIKILLGIEANLTSMDGQSDIDDEIIKNCDIVLLGFHYGVTFKSIKDAFVLLILNYFANFSSRLKRKMIDINTKAIENVMHKYDIDILTHPGDKVFVDIERIAKAAEETNTILEINDSHGHLNIEEIKKASKYNIKFAIGSDAHTVENIGNCDEGIKRAIEAGLDFKRIINIK